MKQALLLLIHVLFMPFVIAGSASAQPSNDMIRQLQNMTPAEQEAFAKQMQESFTSQGGQIMECYNKIDQSEINKMQTETQAMQTRLEALCQAGKRDEAEREAMRFGMQMQQSDLYKQLQSCGQPMQEMTKKWMPQASGDGTRKHLCDQ